MQLPGLAAKDWPCRASCALSIPGPWIIDVRQACGQTSVMNRGDQREDIFRDDEDRQKFLSTLGEACAKTEWLASSDFWRRAGAF